MDIDLFFAAALIPSKPETVFFARFAKPIIDRTLSLLTIYFTLQHFKNFVGYRAFERTVQPLVFNSFLQTG